MTSLVHRTIVSAGLACCLALPLQAKPKPQKAEPAEPAIQKSLVEFAAAWNRHDAAAMASFWTDDGDIINPFGNWAKGRAEVEKLFQEEQAAYMKGSSLTLRSLSVRELGAMALADVEVQIAGITAPDGTPIPSTGFHIAQVWTKRKDKWEILSARPYVFAAMPAAPAAPAATGTKTPAKATGTKPAKKK